MWLKSANVALAASLLLWYPVLFAAGFKLGEYEGGNPGKGVEAQNSSSMSS